MTTPAGHFLFGLGVFLSTPRTSRRVTFILLALLMAAAIIPDIDLFPLLWGDMAAANSNHQQFSHSLLFTSAVALLITLAASLLGCGRFLRLSPYFIAAAWSHLLLDMLTHDSHEPIGIMLFWPFSDTRFNSPVSLFGGLSKSRLEDLISWHNLGVVAGELMVLAPLIVAIWELRLRREGKNPRQLSADQVK